VAALILQGIEVVALGIEVLAVTVIVVGIAYATLSYVFTRRPEQQRIQTYARFRQRLGRVLLIGLEVLLAADIVRTVALEPTIASLLALGLLVVIRTFLSWSLEVEIEGRWPWQGSRTR
jgi:uncharacterized membrane protein